ncbi:hypothetical protein OSB04_020939 [Centaurea solstitialis]|uniref:DUF1985 domain-containing protein n=1 Tax=Centaurea solstitialis TaxID=347529 RepID=A0AA38T4L7_9ASTR|nr:hypothetical protein OSB04_020939 [Centaurea solstitialis]
MDAGRANSDFGRFHRVKQEPDQYDEPDQQSPQRNQGADYYEACLSIRAKISIAKDILAKLSESDRRLALFKGTCFGPWLDIQSKYGDPLLIHLMLQTQFFPEGALADEMWFRIGGHELRFGREEFCLITGFRFGPTNSLPEMRGNPFRERVFPHLPAHKPVKGSDLLSVFDSRAFAQISDLDAVRICLLLLLEVGFIGNQPSSVVSDFRLCLVEDLDSWDRYPWGSYLWALTYKQLKNALPSRQHHVSLKPDKMAKYTLTGFVYAFKIWIFEMFPVARVWASRSDVIPRAVAWKRTLAITCERCLTFLDVDDDGSQPLMGLSPTDAERETDWWKDSKSFFDGVENDFERPAKRVRSYSPPPSFAWFGESSPVAAATTTGPTPLEQRVAALEQTVCALRSSQQALEAGHRALKARQLDLQAGQHAILGSIGPLQETMERVLEASHRAAGVKAFLSSFGTVHECVTSDDDVVEGAALMIIGNVAKQTPPLHVCRDPQRLKVATTLLPCIRFSILTMPLTEKDS